MGRLFVTSVEGPSYRCRSCERVEIAAYIPPFTILADYRMPPQFVYQASLGRLYLFTKCFNVVIGTHETTFTVNGVIDNRFREVFCIACNSHLGFYCEGGPMYNEGNFYIERSKLHGPPDGSDDDDGNEEEVDVTNGSDDEDGPANGSDDEDGPANGSDDEDDNSGNEEDVDVFGE